MGSTLRRPCRAAGPQTDNGESVGYGGLHLAATKSSGFTAAPNRRNHGGMSDPIPGNDPSAAYDVVSSTRWPKEWWTVTCNGIPVWHCATREKAERYATDAEHRASLIVTKYADR